MELLSHCWKSWLENTTVTNRSAGSAMLISHPCYQLQEKVMLPLITTLPMSFFSNACQFFQLDYVYGNHNDDNKYPPTPNQHRDKRGSRHIMSWAPKYVCFFLLISKSQFTNNHYLQIPSTNTTIIAPYDGPNDTYLLFGPFVKFFFVYFFFIN